MIKGIGTDIAQVQRFKKFVINADMLLRFFSFSEIKDCSEVTDDGKPVTEGLSEAEVQKKAERYAARFAAKEAFSKALGTGIEGFSLKEVYIKNDEKGKPELVLEGKARETALKLCGENYCIHVSLSHEKDYAVAFVVIEN